MKAALRVPTLGNFGNAAKIREPERWQGKQPEGLIEKLIALGEVSRIGVKQSQLNQHMGVTWIESERFLIARRCSFHTFRP
jgi:hypothetical protein